MANFDDKVMKNSSNIDKSITITYYYYVVVINSSFLVTNWRSSASSVSAAAAAAMVPGRVPAAARWRIVVDDLDAAPGSAYAATKLASFTSKGTFDGPFSAVSTPPIARLGAFFAV